jgi:hypothetical protein
MDWLVQVEPERKSTDRIVQTGASRRREPSQDYGANVGCDRNFVRRDDDFTHRIA